MTFHLAPAQEEQLRNLASQTGRTPDELAQEAVERFLDYRESMSVAVREGEESAERDGWLSHEEVAGRYSSPNAKRAEAVEEGLAAARRGQLHDHEDVMAMIDLIVERG